MRVVIYVYESEFNGRHGINSGGVFDVDSVKEAEEIGMEYGYDLIDSYSRLFEDIPEDERVDLIEFRIYSIKDSVKLTLEELDEEFAKYDIEFFVETYCEKEICNE